MPTIEVNLGELEHLFGRDIPRDHEYLNNIFTYVKGEVTTSEGDDISIEIKDSNHPDLWGVEGIARALQGYLGLEVGLKEYTISKRSGITITVDNQLEQIRPFIACAIIKEVVLSDKSIKGLMHLQDKLDQTYGRNRSRTSIGVYNYDLIKPPIHYTVSKPEETAFVPLGFNKKLTLKKILQTHPKGIEYGYIIEKFKEWPLLHDSNRNVLSLPPIINSNDLGKVTDKTHNILIEVTGTNSRIVNDALIIMCTVLADRQGKIESTEIKYPYNGGRTVETPDLTTTQISIDPFYINSILGIKLRDKQISELLEKSRFGVKKIVRDKKSEFQVEIPCYRKDILHPIDLIEDIAIAYNLNNIPTQWPKFQTFGGLSNETTFINIIRELCVGLGFQEILSFTMTNIEKQFQKMNLSPKPIVEVSNPKIPAYTHLRTWIIPNLMDFFQHNIHVEYPQKIFEIGKCVERSSPGALAIEEKSKLALATAHKNASFSEIQSILNALSTNLELEITIEPTEHKSFIKGRIGKINFKKETIGILGEIHPNVLDKWNMTIPISALEIDLTKIHEVKI